MSGKRLREKSVTRWLFKAPVTFAIIWVTWSYALATYATVALGQPFPVETLSGQAMDTILGGIFGKLILNVFEHNDGGIFGHARDSRTKESEDT